MTPENYADYSSRREREFLQDGVLIFYPLALNSLIAFDLRTSPESSPKARLLAKKEVLSKDLIDLVTGHFQTTNSKIENSVVEKIGLAVVQKMTEDRPEIGNKTNAVLYFCRSSLAVFLNSQPWSKLAQIILSRVDYDAVVVMFKKLVQEEKSNYSRDLIVGNRLAGFSTIWQRGKNN